MSGAGLTSSRLTVLRPYCSASAWMSCSSVIRPRAMAIWPVGVAVDLASSRISHSWSSSMKPRSIMTWPILRRPPPESPLAAGFLAAGLPAGLPAAGLAPGAGLGAGLPAAGGAGFAPGAGGLGPGTAGLAAGGTGFFGGVGSFGVGMMNPSGVRGQGPVANPHLLTPAARALLRPPALWALFFLLVLVVV